MTNIQLLTLIGTVMALMAGQATIIVLYTILSAKIERLIETVHDMDKRILTLERKSSTAA